MHKPPWFKDGFVAVSNAPTCGINKDGDELFVVDEETGRRTSVIDDKLSADVRAIFHAAESETVAWVESDEIKTSGVAVPSYYDEHFRERFHEYLKQRFPDFKSATVGELVDRGELTVMGGHGSPSADMRTGTIPYIKVSDLRAGQVNINPTNRVSSVVAERYWRRESSGLFPFDLLTPARTSKNIGDFVVLMPGQQNVVLTKEILVFRASSEAIFDQFYLLWALSLKVVRDQWNRIIFMQTNREDVGRRFLEIEIPVPSSAARASEVSARFREYYQGMAELRTGFLGYLREDSDHHVFMGELAESDEDD